MLSASIIFYINISGFSGFCVITFEALYTYLIGLYLHNTFTAKKLRSGKALLLLCLAPIILSLIYFRYLGFIESLIGPNFHWAFKLTNNFSRFNFINSIICPLGISFFAFEFSHYLVDVYKGGMPIKSPLYFSLFALFYPRLASGPIIRYQQIIPQINDLPELHIEDVSVGLNRICLGFLKKFALADPCETLVTNVFHPQNILTGTDVIWLSFLLYVRIYMDFGGYSDMAIGIARIWGIRLPENFNFPFLAASPSDFWRRWHITLSTWIRDYIYIPLGGGRVSIFRKSSNLLIAMALCGLWHGASWNFVLWGIVHGIALQVGHGIAPLGKFLKTRFNKFSFLERSISVIILCLGWVLTQSFVGLSWILFFYPIDVTLKILNHLKLFV
jgi:alginate O-acetyltransferase complex protein AlgI